MNNPIRIFIVEDNLIYQHLIAREMQAICNDIHFFKSGEACLHVLGDKTPDIIVLDYNLDGEMNGLETLQRIREINKHAHVIMFTSEHGLNYQESFEAYGSFDFIEKKEAAFHYLRETIKNHISQTAEEQTVQPTRFGMRKLSVLYHRDNSLS